MNIHERITEQTELAKSYAEDGAFRSAARVLRGLAQEIEAHADWREASLLVVSISNPPTDDPLSSRSNP